MNIGISDDNADISGFPWYCEDKTQFSRLTHTSLFLEG